MIEAGLKLEVEVRHRPPSRAAGTNCLVAEPALLVAAASVVIEVLVGDLEAERLHAGTASCPLLHGSQSPQDRWDLVRAECRL